MNDNYYEESVSTESSKKHRVLKIQLFVFFVIFLVAALMCYIVAASQKAATGSSATKGENAFFTFYLIVAIFFTVFAVLALFLSKRMIYSYDYTYVSGSVHIAKVINNARRKKIDEIDCKKIIKIGRVDSEGFYSTQSGGGAVKTIKCFADKKNIENQVYILTNSTEGRVMYLIECSDTLLSYIVGFTGKTVLAEDFE